MIKKHERMEFIGQIIDIFEDFLEVHKVTLPNPDRSKDEFAAIIYGTDYGDLRDRIDETLQNWELIER